MDDVCQVEPFVEISKPEGQLTEMLFVKFEPETVKL
jgi:hypothetical protein